MHISFIKSFKFQVNGTLHHEHRQGSPPVVSGSSVSPLGIKLSICCQYCWNLNIIQTRYLIFSSFIAWIMFIIKLQYIPWKNDILGKLLNFLESGAANCQYKHCAHKSFWVCVCAWESEISVRVRDGSPVRFDEALAAYLIWSTY